jgi:myosin heavy subunit
MKWRNGDGMKEILKPAKRDFFSIWVNAKIWAFDTADRLWCRGTVEEVIDSTESSWTFAIRLEGNRLRNVTTLFSDKYGTEFQYVKRRSDDDEHMRCAVDMTSLVYLNEPEMLSCLQHRYHTKSIYTNMGPILIAVNPFQHLDESVYGISKINAYATDKTLLKQPHVYQIGERAYSKMFIDKFDPNKRENECILINGESGAG